LHRGTRPPFDRVSVDVFASQWDVFDHQMQGVFSGMGKWNRDPRAYRPACDMATTSGRLPVGDLPLAV
jgi:hypothetical protein